MNKEKIRKILNKLNGQSQGISDAFNRFDNEAENLKKTLKETINIATLAEVNKELDKFKKKVDLSPLLSSISQIKNSLSAQTEYLTDRFSRSLSEVFKNVNGYSDNLVREMEADFEKKLKIVIEEKTKELQKIKEEIPDISKLNNKIDKEISKISETLIESGKDIRKDFSKEIDTAIKGNGDTISAIRKELITKINEKGGGGANRNIAVGGNTSVLSKYTDINIKAGSNVTITYQNNNTTKYLDLTIASSGGGSSVAGTVRSINRIATSQTAGATTGTDYAYICTVGVNLTLPTAVANTNLYTIKNVAASSVLVSTTGGQTIDGDTTAILQTQYAQISLLNDGNDNWLIGI